MRHKSTVLALRPVNWSVTSFVVGHLCELNSSFLGNLHDCNSSYAEWFAVPLTCGTFLKCCSEWIEHPFTPSFSNVTPPPKSCSTFKSQIRHHLLQEAFLVCTVSSELSALLYVPRLTQSKHYSLFIVYLLITCLSPSPYEEFLKVRDGVLPLYCQSQI